MNLTLPALQAPGTLPELDMLEALLARAPDGVRADTVAQVPHPQRRGDTLPLHCIEVGSDDPQSPAIGFFGGVHGVERIGTQVVLAFLQGLVERLDWDETLHEQLARLRLVFMPLVNPGGMLLRSRSNPQGVDLMRNAPVEADMHVRRWLGGQRLSPRLPWYRGAERAPMQPEAAALQRVVQERLLSRPFSLTLDCHSGFGTRDRIWFPYAYSQRPIECLPEIYALRTLFRRVYPYHSIYVIEPQSRHYTAHGDLWDHLHLQSRNEPEPPHFLPLTLEMGSWLWVKKSPSQLFTQLGIFNPVAPHRHRRILRQHTTLLDFLTRATASWQRWLPTGTQREQLRHEALDYWYRQA